jgi:ketosteroid isomerase-like protein
MDEREREHVVRAWIDAVNRGDQDKADALVTDSVSVIGPRGTSSGRDVVAAWVQYTQIRMTPVTVWVDGDRVTVEAISTWQAEGGEPGERTDPETITVIFTVEDGRISSLERTDTPRRTGTG